MSGSCESRVTKRNNAFKLNIVPNALSATITNMNSAMENVKNTMALTFKGADNESMVAKLRIPELTTSVNVCRFTK